MATLNIKTIIKILSVSPLFLALPVSSAGLDGLFGPKQTKPIQSPNPTPTPPSPPKSPLSSPVTPKK